jgi:DNA-binding transcriptional MerR regulator
MRYRVDELARLSGVSVDTVRFYQGRGLIEPPERDGRVAWYSDDHLARLRHIRELKDQGFNLGSIRRLLDGEIDAADRALAAAVVDPSGSISEGVDELLSLEELATTTGVSPALLAAIEREGLLTPLDADGRAMYSRGDVETVRAGLALLESGLPLSELLALARKHDAAMRTIAEEAVEMFVRFVRDPIRAHAVSGDEAAARLIDAFRNMLPATTQLVARHFERVLLDAARARAVSEGLSPEDAGSTTSAGRG